jgi:hypothetical protein
MYLPNGYKFKYEHVEFKYWPLKLGHMAFKLHGGYIPTL